MNMNLSELINEILSEWAYRCDDGMPNPKNPIHLKALGIVLSEMGLSHIKNQLVENLLTEKGKTPEKHVVEADKQFKNPILNKSIKYKNAKGEDAEGLVGNLLRLPAEHPGRKAAERLLPPDGSDERDTINKDLGGENQPQKPEAPTDATGAGEEQPQEDPIATAAAMFDPKNDPAMAARLDKEKETLAQIAKDTEDKGAESEKDVTPEVETDFNPIPAVDVQDEIPQADPDTFGGESDIPDGIDEKELEQFNTDINKVKQIVDDAKAKGEKAPNINLCQITVPGTNLYCDDNLGIPREEMPQFKGKAIEGSRAANMPVDEDGEVDTEPVFKEMLKEKGINTVQTEVPADKLKATQSELVGAKVVGMVGALEENPQNEKITAPIYVSRDGYIIDGHHRWAAIAAYNAQHPDAQIPMKTTVLDMDIKEAIPMANKFAEDMGIAAKKADANKETPTEKLPEPKAPSEKDGGVVYSLGGGYYSDTPNGPAQYRVVENIVEEVLLEGNESLAYLLFEATVTKKTSKGKTVKLKTIEPKDQKQATAKAANSKGNTQVNYDSRVDGETSAKVEQTYNTDAKFSEPGMKHDDRVKRLKEMKASEINSTSIDDVYTAMGIKKGTTKFPAKYMSVLSNALNFAKGPFTITDLTDAAGAGTLDSTLGELVTLMGATIQDENQRNQFFNYLREQVKAGGNVSALTVAWINSAQDSCVAFHRKIQKDCPGGHEVKTNFWDIPSEAQAAGVKNYKRDKGKSTDINTMVDCISKDGTRTQKWLQPSLKKSKKVNAFNSTTGRVFATTVLRWGTPQEKAQYSALGNELDSYNGLDDNAPAGENTITDKRGNVRPMTIKERKTQLNASMRAIEEIYEDKIPVEANPKQAVIRQRQLHDDYLNDSKAVKERDAFLYKWLDMKPSERKKLAEEIAKQMGQKGDKYAKELEADLNKLSEYDTSTAAGLDEALKELGFTASKDRQKIMVAVMNGVINTAGNKTKSAEYKKIMTKNSHDHSKAVLEYLIRDNDNKKALLENISTQFPLKDLMEGKEWAILGEKGGGINLDRDTITKCLGADRFEDVVEKLIIVDYKGEPTLAYATDNGKRTVPIGEINCRPDGIMYGGTWKLELSIHDGFADCCKQHDK
jgi:hypothetical protein